VDCLPSFKDGDLAGRIGIHTYEMRPQMAKWLLRCASAGRRRCRWSRDGL